MTANTMTCTRFNAELMAYLENETDVPLSRAIERHSLTCDECGSLLADLRKLRTDAGNLPELTPSRDLWSGIAARIEAPVVSIGTRAVERRDASRRWLRPALMAASLVAAAGVGYLAAGSRADVAAPTVTAPVARTVFDTVIQVASTIDTVLVPAANAPRTSGDVASVSQARTPSAPARAVTAVAAQRSPEVQLAVQTLTADYDREIARLRLVLEQRRNQLDPATVAVIEKNLAIIDTAITESKLAVARDPSSRFLIETLNHSLRTKVELMRTAALLPSRT